MKFSLLFFLLACSIWFINVTAQTKKITLSDIYNSRLFYQRNIENIRSMNDGEYYTILNRGNILRYSYKTGLFADTILSAQLIHNIVKERITNYTFSADERKILLTTHVQSIYRHSFTASFFVYDRDTRNIYPVSNNGDQQLADFSPDGLKVAFVRANNIFISDFKSGTEQAITTDGEFNEIINGAPDWVYEEEFGFSKAFEWSPNGKSIAYMRFDERRVRMFSMVVYDSLYPSVQTFKYPKAGEDNSLVSVWVYNLENKTSRQMDTGKETDQYIPRMKWTSNPEKLCILRLNRLQNKIDVILSNINTAVSTEVFSETNKYFISEVDDNYIRFNPDGKYFLIFSERTGYRHIYRYSIDGKFSNPVTSGNFDVTGFLSMDNVNQVIYYVSAESSPLNRDIYSIQLDGKNKKRISVQEGTSSAEFSATHKYYILKYSNANEPVTYKLYSNKGDLIRVLEEKKEFKQRIKEYGFQPKTFFTVPASGNLQLNGYMIKPAGFDSLKKYPLLMFVYGGPQSQNVTNSWGGYIDWFQFMAQQGYIIACVDNRGTDGRGEEFRKCTYLQLGKLELEDQVNAARYLGKLPYVDASRIGIFGWSYGGYMVSLCMTKGEGTFKAGVAVAPVTNWRYYDNIYTERFMRKPQDNPGGYDDNSPINFASGLQGNFLLIHGSADDNVHLQNTMVFSEKLVQAGKQFDQAIYTDKNHGIYGGKTYMHLFTRITEFFLQNL